MELEFSTSIIGVSKDLKKLEAVRDILVRKVTFLQYFMIEGPLWGCDEPWYGFNLYSGILGPSRNLPKDLKGDDQDWKGAFDEAAKILGNSGSVIASFKCDNNGFLNDNIYTIPSGSRYTKSMASFNESIKESFENPEEVLNAFEKASHCYTKFVRDDNLIPDWVKKEKCVQEKLDPVKKTIIYYMTNETIDIQKPVENIEKKLHELEEIEELKDSDELTEAYHLLDELKKTDKMEVQISRYKKQIEIIKEYYCGNGTYFDYPDISMKIDLADAIKKGKNMKIRDRIFSGLDSFSDDDNIYQLKDKWLLTKRDFENLMEMIERAGGVIADKTKSEFRSYQDDEAEWIECTDYYIVSEWTRSKTYFIRNNFPAERICIISLLQALCNAPVVPASKRKTLEELAKLKGPEITEKRKQQDIEYDLNLTQQIENIVVELKQIADVKGKWPTYNALCRSSDAKKVFKKYGLVGSGSPMALLANKLHELIERHEILVPYDGRLVFNSAWGYLFDCGIIKKPK